MEKAVFFSNSRKWILLLAASCLLLIGCGISSGGSDIGKDSTTDTTLDGSVDGFLPDLEGEVLEDVREVVEEDLVQELPYLPDAQVDTDTTVDTWEVVDLSEVADSQDSFDLAEDELGGCIDTYPGQVLITEIMLVPSVGSDAGCYIELYNAGFEALRMKGWELLDGSGNLLPLDLPDGVPFEPGDYVVLGFEEDPLLNGGLVVDLVVSGFDLSAQECKVQGGGLTIDSVNWSSEGWPAVAGASMSLEPAGYVFNLNDDPTHWCAASTPYGDGDLGTPGDANPLCGVAPVCGDFVVEDPEECDDGNTLPGDGCSPQCTLEMCGNGILDEGEACDDGNLDECDGCLSTCVEHANLCGDGFVCDLEGCDDGNLDECDGCLSTCVEHANVCGDGFWCAPEECDDGNEVDDDECSNLCTTVIPPLCPSDMVEIPANPALGVAEPFCMDRYEASRPDATVTSPGVDESSAKSAAGVIPWYVNPFVKETHLPLFSAACVASGKRLCTPEEWYFGCTGTESLAYVWGNSWDAEVCNSVDSFCDDFCMSNGIALENCNLAQNCGYSYYCFHVVPTGTFDQCISEFGVYDVNGNVWEIVPSTADPRGFEVRGGAFNCGSPVVRLQCTYNAGWTSLYAGFRCCK